MKVLHVAASIARSYGGPTQSLAGYAASARLQGIEVAIAAPECTIEDAEAMARQSGVEEITLFRSFSRGAFIVSPALIRWLRNEARRFDLIHVQGLFNPVSSLAIRTAQFAERPVVVCPHGTLSRYTFEHRRTLLKRAYLSAIERTNVERAAAIHFTTETEWAEAKWHRIDFDSRAHVVPPPFLEHSENGPRHDTKQTGLVALFLSRIHPVKNVAGLLRAWQLVLASEPSAQLIIAGPGKPVLVQSLKALAMTLGVAQSVTFFGFVGEEEKARLFSQATLFALPSHHENFGLVVLEAVAAGVPAVISPEVQLAPFVERHGLGVIAASDPETFGAAILRAMHDAPLKTRVAATGWELVRRHHAPAVIGDALARMYLSALSRAH